LKLGKYFGTASGSDSARMMESGASGSRIDMEGNDENSNSMFFVYDVFTVTLKCSDVSIL